MEMDKLKLKIFKGAVYSQISYLLCQIGTLLDLPLVKLDLAKFKRASLTYNKEEEEVSQRYL